MTLVRIVKSWASPDLFRQTPGGAGSWGNCRFTLEPVERCDYLLILNHTPAPITVAVPRENIWCLVQEPPDPAHLWMRQGFRHCARVYTQDPALRGVKYIQHHGALPWHVGRTYDELLDAPSPVKTRPLSWITSSLAIHPGHRRRLAFLDRLRAEVPFDLFGRGFQPIPDKWDGLAPYRYAIAVENSSIPHYWTEKVMDCFLAGTMPLYFGATNLSAYFPKDSFVWIDIDDPSTPRRIAEIIKSDLAEKNRDAILEARRRVLEQHQFFPFIANLIAAVPAPSPPSVATRLTLPAVPDHSEYYRKHGPLARLRHRILRRLRLTS